ncbi:glycoside hydrolase family 6 protein [Streptomyces sp. NPDC012888]|uniref:glycoside hydrolase family 6 protein n=1 Tax=Streptomyces sp. NPDC012888 TaxID=3364855 RepID=UPI003695FE55
MPGHSPRRRPLAAATTTAATAAAACALALAAVAGCTPPPPPRTGPPSPAAAPPAEETGSPFWVDPRSAAARQAAAWDEQGRTADAQVLRRIADRPVALWAPAGDPGPAVRRAARAAAAAGRTVVIAAHALPHPGCGRPPGGGARDAQAYRRWISALADAIGGARALVVLEPGAMAEALDGCAPAGRTEGRHRLLAEAVDRLKRNRGTRVYLDASRPGRFPDPADLAGHLARAGLGRADGFALNVSGFEPDAAVRAYGAKLSRATGGKHFVVDTGRNGDGPRPDGSGPGACNPPGRSLGVPPTDRTGDPLADAYLWIRRPGESDGTCRGGPAAGTWWPDYALGLARRAKDPAG